MHYFVQIKVFFKAGWRCSLVVEPLPRMYEAIASIPDIVQRDQKLELNYQIFYYWIQMDSILDNMSNKVIMQALCIIHSPFLCFEEIC